MPSPSLLRLGAMSRDAQTVSFSVEPGSKLLIIAYPQDLAFNHLMRVTNNRTPEIIYFGNNCKADGAFGRVSEIYKGAISEYNHVCAFRDVQTAWTTVVFDFYHSNNPDTFGLELLDDRFRSTEIRLTNVCLYSLACCDCAVSSSHLP